jgi:hypothetical protein
MLPSPITFDFQRLFGQPFLPWHKAAVDDLSAKSISSKPRVGKSLSGEWIRGAVTGEKTDVGRSETVSAVWGQSMT